MNINIETLRLYWAQIRQHKPSFFTALTLVPLAALSLDTLLPFFLAQAIGALTEQNNSTLAQNLIIAAGVGVGGSLLNFIGFRTLIHHESNIRTKLYNTMFRSLLKKDYAFFTNEKIGALTSRFIDFNRAHVALQDLLIIRTLTFALSLIIGLSIVAYSSPILAAILLGLIVMIAFEIKFFTVKRRPYRHERKILVGEIHGEVADSLSNSMLVKTFGNETQEIDVLEKKTKRLQKIYLKDIGLFAIDGAIRNLVAAVTQVICIAVCAYLVIQGTMDLAIAIFAIAYLQRIASRVFELGEIINGYDENFLQAAPMTEILHRPNRILDTPGANILPRDTSAITFESVDYRYNDSSNPVIESLNLYIPEGQRVGLVGHSGAGKTTITNLLLRFDDVSAGKIKIGEHDLRAITQESLRKSIAYVPQDPVLFHRSLRENIAYGKLEATDKEVQTAARQANAFDFISQLPDGLDTLVGERGVKLSGGQRQRIAIARAILKDAPILILDEATSALDSESEKLIQASLETLMKGRTSIVIAHRLSTIAKLDRIIVLENGTIAEDGTHSELLKKNGIYASLWNHQSGGFIEE